LLCLTQEPTGLRFWENWPGTGGSTILQRALDPESTGLQKVKNWPTLVEAVRLPALPDCPWTPYLYSGFRRFWNSQAIIILRNVVSNCQVSKTSFMGVLFADWTSYRKWGKSCRDLQTLCTGTKMRWRASILRSCIASQVFMQLVQQHISCFFLFRACMMDWNKPFMANSQMKDFFCTIAWKYVSLYDVQMLTYGRWYVQSRCCRLRSDKIVLKMLSSWP
jgi:hypothetical protein